MVDPSRGRVHHSHTVEVAEDLDLEIRSDGSVRDRLSRFWSYVPVGRAGRVAIVTLAVAIVAIDVTAAIAGASDVSTATTVAQAVLTLSFALFAWRPPTAAIVLQFGALIAVVLGANDATLLAVAAGSGLVMATCSIALAVLYLVGLVLLIVAAGTIGLTTLSAPSVIVIVLATVTSSLIGLLLRRMLQRTAQLASDLEARQRMLEEAVQAERDRIADELHDFIAHELTIIAMHARVLQQSVDEEVQRQSREAIDGSARQALADIRRVLELTQASRAAEEEPPAEELAETERRRLVPTVADVERELLAAGVRLELDGVYEVAPTMSRSMDMAMAQFLREAATNIIKHADPSGPVSVRLTNHDDAVTMRIRNAVAGTGSLTLPRGGYGLERMRERASVLGGRFKAGPDGDEWLVEVQLPSR